MISSQTSTQEKVQAATQNQTPKELLNKAVELIVRPPRLEYNLEQFPTTMRDSFGNIYSRHSVTMYNDRNQRIIGSIYLQQGLDPFEGGPCVIYLHGNSSSQKEGKFLVPNICSRRVSMFCFDFSGSGNSDGDYISLGYFETKDLFFLINELKNTFNMGPFALWGRSMGAATAILCTSPLIACKVVDSAYTSIPDVCKAIATTVHVPPILHPGLVWYLKQRVSAIAQYDISSVSPLNSAKDPNQPPLLMCHSKTDEFVPYEQGVKIFEAYSNPDKEFREVQNGHNGSRGQEFNQSAINFIMKHLGVDSNETEAVNSTTENQDAPAHFKSFNDMAQTAEQKEND